MAASEVYIAPGLDPMEVRRQEMERAAIWFVEQRVASRPSHQLLDMLRHAERAQAPEACWRPEKRLAMVTRFQIRAEMVREVLAARGLPVPPPWDGTLGLGLARSARKPEEAEQP